MQMTTTETEIEGILIYTVGCDNAVIWFTKSWRCVVEPLPFRGNGDVTTSRDQVPN